MKAYSGYQYASHSADNAARAAIVQDAGGPRVAVAAPVMDNGRVLAMAYVRMPLSTVTSPLAATSPGSGYLALRQGRHTIFETGDTALATSAEVDAVRLEGTVLRVVAAAPLADAEQRLVLPDQRPHCLDVGGAVDRRVGQTGAGVGVRRPVDLLAPGVGGHDEGALVDVGRIGETVEGAHTVHGDAEREPEGVGGHQTDPQPGVRAGPGPYDDAGDGVEPTRDRGDQGDECGDDDRGDDGQEHDQADGQRARIALSERRRAGPGRMQ